MAAAEKTSLSISLPHRELLRAIGDLQNITMEQVAHKAVVRLAESLAHNLANANTKPYELITPRLKAAQREMEARSHNISFRSRHMRRINTERRQARKASNDSGEPYTPRRRATPAYSVPYNDGIPHIIEHPIQEMSDLTMRRLRIGATRN